MGQKRFVLILQRSLTELIVKILNLIIEFYFILYFKSKIQRDRSQVHEIAENIDDRRNDLSCPDS